MEYDIFLRGNRQHFDEQNLRNKLEVMEHAYWN